MSEETEPTTNVSGEEVVTDLSGEEVVTDLSGEEIIEEGPLYIATLDELLASRNTVLQKQAKDLQELGLIDSPDPTILRRKLFEWAEAGFPDAFPVYSINVVPPEVCSDGVQRTLYEYIQFLTGETIVDKMAKLEAKLQGIKVLNSFSGCLITIHVIKSY